MGNYLTLIDECQGFSISNRNILSLRYLTNSLKKILRSSGNLYVICFH